LLDVIRSSEGSFSAADAALAVPVDQVDGDAHLLELWLHGRSPHTQRAYSTDAADFLTFVSKPLRTVTVGDVQAWMDTLEEHLAPGSRARKISSVKSLFGFGHRLGYLPFESAASSSGPSSKTHWPSASCPKATSIGSSSPLTSLPL